MSQESGQEEVYVRGFPAEGPRETISQGGGQYPRWSPDGNTVYYWTVSPWGSVISLMGARVQRGPPFVVLATDSILQGAYDAESWALHPDGDRIVVTRNAPTSASAEAQPDGIVAAERFVVVTNWFEELRQRVGSK